MFNIGAIQRLISKPIVPVINITGVIGLEATKRVERSLQKINTSLAKAVALVINSPGGSPVQSQIIVEKVTTFCKNHHFPLYTFAEDMAASGGYFLLCAGDKVYVDQTSLVGSIGAIIGWTGFRRLLQDKKIETRRWSTQENLLQHILDSVGDLEQHHKDYLAKTSHAVHDKFVQHVESYRSAAIKVPKEQRQAILYNADVFLGTKAVEFGLADGIGTYQDVLYNEFPNAIIQPVNRLSFLDRFRQQRGIKVQVDLNQLYNLEGIAQKQLMAQFLKADSMPFTVGSGLQGGLNQLP